jgi:uncharacterized membrane-anchored protein YjiN (DUF445 family)
LSDSSARDRYVQALMSHVAEDQYPSATQLQHLEAMLSRDQIEDYVNLLIEKIVEDRYPSVPMMQRVERLLAQLGS